MSQGLSLVPQNLSELGLKSAGCFGCCVKIPLLMMKPFHNSPVICIHLWPDLKEVLKQILQHYIKKYRGQAGGCDHTFLLFFPSRAKEFNSYHVGHLHPAESGQKITECMRGVQ